MKHVKNTPTITIFVKQLAIYLAILFMSLGILSGMLSEVVEDYFGALIEAYPEPPETGADNVITAYEPGQVLARLQRMISISMVLSALVGGFLIYVSSKAISRPLRDMNQAAQVIAAGDFNKRIKVTGSDEVGQLAASFNHMAKSLAQEERIKRDFITNLSHDIRSPLTSMKGFLQALNDGVVNEDEIPLYFGIVMQETERLIKLSNTLLDAGWLRSLEPGEFDINELIAKTTLSFVSQFTYKKIDNRLEFENVRQNVYANQESIQRVLYNLLDNAAKFTPRGGTIKITSKAGNGEVIVSVTDTGPGIPLKDTDRIFERFYKGDSSRSGEGVGLGLSIVKRMVQAHGGRIHAINLPEGGACFTFTLPEESGRLQNVT